MRSIIEKITIEAINEINIDLELEELENITLDMELFNILDSLGTLDLVIELESRLQKEFGKYIQVANDTTMDSEKTDFKTLNKLIEYLVTKVS